MFTYQFIFSVIFFISLLLVVGMVAARLLYEKLHDEHLFHKWVTHPARNANLYLKVRIKKVQRLIRYCNKKTFSLFIHLVMEKLEEHFHKITDWVRSKFPHHK